MAFISRIGFCAFKAKPAFVGYGLRRRHLRPALRRLECGKSMSKKRNHHNFLPRFADGLISSFVGFGGGFVLAHQLANFGITI